MSSTSAANKVAYDMLQTTMARQLVTVWDLYGLLGLSPGADEKAIREAYEKLSQGVQPEVPANVVRVLVALEPFFNPHPHTSMLEKGRRKTNH